MPTSPLLSRLVHTVIAVAALIALPLVAMCLYYALLLVVMMIFFIFNITGDSANRVMNGFVVPLFYFVGGMIAAGGAVALLNAIVAPRPYWLRSIAAGAVVGGIVAVVHPAIGPWMMETATPVFAFIKDPYDTGYEREELRAAAFAKSQKAVVDTFGRKGLKASRGGVSMTDNVPRRYRVALSGAREGYAIVEVKRQSGSAEFTLVCVFAIGVAANPERCEL